MQDTLSNKASKTTELEQHDELKQIINNQSELLINQSKLILELTARLDEQKEYINKQIDVKPNEAIEQAKEIVAPEPDETPKEIEEHP